MIWNLFKQNREAEIEKLKSEDFIKKNLKHNLAHMSSITLIDYLKFHFPKDGQNYATHRNNVQVVRSLDKVDLSAAIAKMTRIEQSRDQKRHYFFIGLLFTTSTTFAVILSKNDSVPFEYLLVGYAIAVSLQMLFFSSVL